MAESNVFPAFVQIKVDDREGFAEFNTKLANELNKAKRTTEVSLGEIERVISGALVGGQVGNFTVDTKGAREAAAASEQRAESARKMAVALQVAAASENNYSAAAQAAVIAAARVATEETEAARAARVHADAVDYLKQAMDRQGIAVDDVVNGNNRLTRSNGVLRMAYVQTGQQLQDITISMIGGQKASVVFAQQLPQLAFALSGLGMQADGTQRGIGRIATLLSGPWGVAFTGAAFAVGMLVEKLWQSESASNKASDALGKVKFSTDSVSDAQSILGNVMDIATGKITAQSEALKGLAVAQATLGKVKAQVRAQELRDEVKGLTVSKTVVEGGFGGGLNISRKEVGAVGAISSEVLLGSLTSEEATQRLENLKNAGALTAEEFAKAATAIASLGVELRNIETFEGAERLLNGEGTAADKKLLLKPATGSNLARLNAQARLDAADSPLESARAELALEKATSAELLRQGKITETQYLANVRSREVEVQRQQGLKEATAQGEKQARAYQKLLDFGERAQESISRIGERFDDQPRLIDQAAQATRSLDKVMADLAARKPPGFEQMIADAERAKGIVENGLTKPYRDLIKQMDQDLTIGQLILDGREAEADALRTILALKERTGQVDAQQVQNIANMTQKLRDQERLMQKLRDQQQPYLNALSDIRSSITETFADFRTKGAGALGDFVDRFRRTFDNLSAEILTESLFGDTLREIEDSILGRKKDIKTDVINQALLSTAAKVEILGNAVANAANKIEGAPVAANDNAAQAAYTDDIVVTASRAMQSPIEFLSSSLTKLFERFLPEGLAKDVGKYVGEAMQGAAYGQMAGGLVLGNSNSKLGSSIGGAIGNVVGKELGSAVGGMLGKFGGPLGSIAGGILGGAIGGLFTSAKWGTAAVSGNSDGDVSVAGNKSAYRSNASLASTSIQSGLQSIAEQFGVDVGNYAVSIGQYKGNWRVSSTGRTGKLKGKYGDVTDFGEDGAEDAIKFAIADAVKDGALQGLRASTQALLSASDDVEAQLQKALDFEDVFARLKGYTDPVGAALDTLDKEFTRLRNIFDEAGASAEEYADLEKLYGIERAEAIKSAAEKVTASLKSLFDDLTVGNDARSLRERLAEAQAAYDPLAKRVAAGDTTAYDDYADAAAKLLDLQRQIYGSGDEYFKMLDQITALTKSRIDAETSLAEASANRESLFASDSSLAPVVSATETQTAQIVSALNDNNVSMLTAMQVQTDNIIALTRTIAAQGNSNAASGLSVARNNY